MFISMKKAYCALLSPVLAISLNLSAQESLLGEINYSQLESYVQLAKDNYYKSKILKVEEERSKSEVGAAQISYLRSEEHTSELQSRENLVCRLLLENKN